MPSKKCILIIFRKVIICNFVGKSKLLIILQKKQINQMCAIFVPMTEDALQLIRSNKLWLQGQFMVNKNPQQIVNLILTNSFIVLKQKGLQSTICSHYAQLSYQTKFQIIYEQEKPSPFSQNCIFSNKIGFFLHKQGIPSVRFTALSENVVEIWIKYLSKLINQFGFHELYTPIKKLGKGAFATVFQVERATDKKHFAVKAFSKQSTINSEDPINKLNLLNQIRIMRIFDSPNIIKLEGVFETDNSLYVVEELLLGGQLQDKINARVGQFTMGEIRQIMVGLAKGLAQIHEKRIMHRDIKPENIMFRYQNKLDLVIVDFGLSAYVDSDYILYKCGTPGYFAPQITTLKKGQKVEPKCDIFSAGVIFHILLIKKPLFEGMKLEDIYHSNRHMKINLRSYIYRNVHPLALDLLEKMLKSDVQDRISAVQMLEHPFLRMGDGSRSSTY